MKYQHRMYLNVKWMIFYLKIVANEALKTLNITAQAPAALCSGVSRCGLISDRISPLVRSTCPLDCG
jgi:hypothetical protein